MEEECCVFELETTVLLGWVGDHAWQDVVISVGWGGGDLEEEVGGRVWWRRVRVVRGCF